MAVALALKLRSRMASNQKLLTKGTAVRAGQVRWAKREGTVLRVQRKELLMRGEPRDSLLNHSFTPLLRGISQARSCRQTLLGVN